MHSDINQLKPGDIIQEIYGDYGHVCVFCGIENAQAMVIDQATGSYAISQYHQWWGPFENQTRVYRGPTDTVKPRISNVKVTHITSEGYTVSCNVSDNVGVTRVAFPTWTSQKGQDDITDPWPDGSLNNGIATYSVRVSDHNNERDCEYITHIYAYDAAGNFECVATSANVPGTRGSEMRTGYSRTLADGDYFRIWVSDSIRPAEVSLELRSTGLQWFLSFYLVFLVESQDVHKNAILLLDEAGLTLHPLAQKDLAKFFNKLSQTNQIINTTHSPFIVDTNNIDRCKVVYIDESGLTVASDNLRQGSDKLNEKSIYAVHAALGLSVYSKTDFIVKNDGSFVCLECDSLPHLNPDSQLVAEANAAGITFGDFCERVIEISLTK